VTGVPSTGPDLAPQVADGLPSAVVGGGKGAVTVRVANRGLQRASGPVAVKLFASPDATLDAGDTEVTAVTRSLRVKSGGTSAVRLKFNYPTGLPAGSYFLLAQVDAGPVVGGANGSNDVAAAPAPVQIAPPFVDLAATSAVAGGSGLAVGRRGSAAVVVTNRGNVAASGPVAIDLSAVPQGGGAPAALTSVTKSFRIKPGQSKRVGLRFVTPTLSPSAYVLRATLAPDASLRDTDPTNNVVDAAGAIAPV
jgi:hypothetical protein